MKKLTALFSLSIVWLIIFLLIQTNTTYAKNFKNIYDKQTISVSAVVPEQLTYSISNNQLTISTNAKNWQIVDINSNFLYSNQGPGEFSYSLPEKDFTILMGY